MVAEDHNPQLCPYGKEIGVFPYPEDAHSWDLGWCADLFFAEGLVFAKGDLLVSTIVLD